MPGKTDVKISMNPEFLRGIQNAAKAGVRDCFKKQILPSARARSPKRSGDNAKSIGIKVRSYPGKVSASIFTNSGHGGYVEKGTSKMAAQPYIYPSVEEGLATLPGLLQARIEEFSKGNVEEIPDEVISNAVSKLKSSHDKGVGIMGAKEAKKKKQLKKLRKQFPWWSGVSHK